MYHLACFPPVNEHSKEEIEIIPDVWLSPCKKTCFYPPFMRGELERALQTRMSPDISWNRRSMRILQSYDSYEKALEKLSVAGLNSNSGNTKEVEQIIKRKRHIKRKKLNCNSDSDIDVPYKNRLKRQKSLPLPPSIGSLPSSSSSESISGLSETYKSEDHPLSSSSETVQNKQQTISSHTQALHHSTLDPSLQVDKHCPLQTPQTHTAHQSNPFIVTCSDSYERAEEKPSVAELALYLESNSGNNKEVEQIFKRKRHIKRKEFDCNSDSETDVPYNNRAKIQKRLPLPPAIASLPSRSLSESISGLPETNRSENHPPSSSLEIDQSKQQTVSSQVLHHLTSDQSLEIAEHFALQTPLRPSALQRDSDITTASAFEKTVLQWMERTNMLLKENAVKLNNILHCLQNKDSNEGCATDCFSSLPLKTSEDMEDFEKFLENSDSFKKVVHYLSGKGGNNVKDTTRRTLKAVISADLASIFNWAGRGSKRAFKDTMTKQLIICAVRNNKFCRTAHEKDIEENIKLFLKYAPLRVLYNNKCNVNQ